MRFLIVFIFSVFVPVLSQAGVLATKNVTVVYSMTTGKPLMVVTDAENLRDPAWNPPNSAQLSVPIEIYNTLNTANFQNYVDSVLPAALDPVLFK